MRQYSPLLLLLTAYLFVGSLYAIYTPPWQAPDEPAHYNYIRQLSGGRLPVIEPDDYDEAYRREIVSARFDPAYSIDPLTYEDWQPPLYYLLLTPIYLLFSGLLLPLRLTNVVLGAGVVGLTYVVSRQVWPRKQWPALLAASFVAFLPQHVAMLAAVNNDSLAELLIGVLLALLLHQSARPDTSHRRWLLIGLVLGLGFLAKATVYIMAPVIALAIFLLYRRDRALMLRIGALTFVPAFLLGLPWWLRNLFLYPGLDPMATAAHDRAVVGQVRTAEWVSQFGLIETVMRLLRTTFQSFWGQFGWMGVVMDGRIYLLLFIFTIVVLLGLLWATVRVVRPGHHPAANRNRLLPAVILVVTFLLSLGVFIGYNITFVQHQGRYLFPALIPIAAGVTLGLKSWLAPLLERARNLPLAGAVVFLFAVAFLALDLWALFRFIVPQLTLP
ncbi:MAG: DUF2142 domain-containing protein [Chloroflexota bacterium]